MTKRWSLLLIGFLLVGLLLTGCGNEKKTLIIGLDDQFPPMGFRNEKNEIVGFDVDMAREASKRMGVQVEFKPIDWSSKESELKSKRVDLLWNGLTILEKRKENILFSNPYMTNKLIIIVPAGSTIATKSNLAGRNIGVQDSSSAVDALEKQPDVLASFKELKKYPDNISAFLDLQNGRVDALVIDEVVGRYYMSKKPGEFTVLTDNFGSEEYGVGMRKDDTKLQEKINKTLDEMKADGTAAKISEKWFGANLVK